jgi:hypothetical protein
MFRPRITVIETRRDVVDSVWFAKRIINKIIYAERIKNLVAIMELPVGNGDIVGKALLNRRGRLSGSLK